MSPREMGSGGLGLLFMMYLCRTAGPMPRQKS
jgi:hypothetical protein